VPKPQETTPENRNYGSENSNYGSQPQVNIKVDTVEPVVLRMAAALDHIALSLSRLVDGQAMPLNVHVDGEISATTHRGDF
tara:strand:+ start:123 stop:365 length:243 start_codon:yes stop_codon:yes gene_type:complete